MFWRHVVASHLEVENVPEEHAGSEAYQTEHMGLIFEDGLSFSGFERDKLFVNDGAGRFVDLSSISGADNVGDGRALVVADFDDDGDPDVFLHNIQRERHALYRNEAPPAGNGFVKVRVVGTAGARDAAGAVVRLALESGAVMARVVALGSGFVSQDAAELVFGLGTASGGTLSVTWPGGEREEFGAVTAGARLRLVEGAGLPVAVPARTFAWDDPLPPGLRVRTGERLASLSVVDADGRQRDLDLTSDGETLLNLWATTCAGCVKEIPDLQELHAQPGTRVIGLSVDRGAARGKAGGLLQRRGGEYANWFVDDAVIETFADPERLMIPTTLRLGPDGTILQIIRGPLAP